MKYLKRFLNKLDPADILAVILIIGYLVLNWKGIPTMLTSAVMLIIGWYFSNKSHKKR